MPIEQYNQVPPALRPLLTRAYSYAMFTRWHGMRERGIARRAPRSFAPQLAAQPPANAWGTAGRNDPCHCGSGKKYKHCHGQIA
jgi:preprotein translocase subunit SecA